MNDNDVRLIRVWQAAIYSPELIVRLRFWSFHYSSVNKSV